MYEFTLASYVHINGMEKKTVKCLIPTITFSNKLEAIKCERRELESFEKSRIIKSVWLNKYAIPSCKLLF